MLGESIAASLIASGIAKSANSAADSVYEKISGKVSSSDAEILTQEFIENLAVELGINGLSKSHKNELEEIFESLNTTSVGSIHQSRDDLVQYISDQINAGYTTLSPPENCTVEDAVSNALDNSVTAWFNEVDKETELEILLLSSREIDKKVNEIADLLGSSIERQGQHQWHTIIEVDNPATAADSVSELLGRDTTDTDSFVDRPEIPSGPEEERYLIIGRHGLGKTRTIDHIQKQYLQEYPIENVIVPGKGFLKPGDAQALSTIESSGDLLLVWDDIGGMNEGLQDTTVRETIFRLSEKTAQNGNRLFVVAAVESGELSMLENIDRTGDRLWDDFEKIRLSPLSRETVDKLCEKEVESQELSLSDTERAHLKEQVWLSDPSPLYIEFAISTIDPTREISIHQQIEDLPSDIEDIWKKEYDVICREYPEARFILWAKRLLKMGAIPAYETTLREVYSQVFDRDEFSFKQPLQFLEEKQWLWKGSIPNHDVDETIYDARDAQMEAVDEDDTRVIDQFAEFLLGSLSKTVPTEVADDWLPQYHANAGMFFTLELVDGTFDLAEAQLERALELSPLNPVVRNNYATYLQMDGRFDEAVTQYEMILSVDPDWIDIRLTYATTLDELGRKYEAEKQYQKIINSEYYSPDTHSNLGMLYSDIGRYNEAREQYETAISMGDTSTQTYNNLGVLYSDRGDLLAAIEIWKQGLQDNPQDRKMRLNLARCFLKLEYPDRARDVLKPLAEEDQWKSDAEVHGRLAVAYSDLGEVDLTKEHWECAKEAEYGRNPLGEQFLEDIDIVDITSDSNYEDKPDLVRVIDYLRTDGAYQTAYNKAEELLNQNYESEDLYLTLGVLAEEIGQTESAHNHFQKAIEFGDETARPYRNYANFCKHQGDLEKAGELFEKAVSLSRAPQILCDYGIYLFTIESYDSAEAIYGEALAYDDTEFPDIRDRKKILLNYGNLLSQQNRDKTAKAHFKRALNIDPEYTKGKFAISQVEMALGNYESAISFLTESISGFASEGMFKEWSMALIQCISILKEENEIQQALKLCEQGIGIAQTQGNRGFQLISILESLQYELQKFD